MIENNKKILKFPKDFLWGVSTSAYQIEGGIANDWSRWEKSEVRIKKLEKEGKNPDDFICGQACDSYNRYAEDAKLAKGLNCGAYRLGIEWSRIEPEEGKWDRKEIEHYRKVLENLKANNLKVVLTLWHWANPTWLAESGGWSNKKTIEHFLRYSELIVKELGDLVDYWVTINEPMMHVANGYIISKWPPNQKNFFKAHKTFKNLVKAHEISYGIIHDRYPEAQVGLTMLANYFEPARKWCPVEVIYAYLANHFWNDKFLKKLKGKFDYVGVDYYFHDRLVWHPPFKRNFDKKITDMGWEIYPKGIYYVLKNYKKFNKPLFIMENGIADRDDNQRSKFIIDHLKYVHQAISERVNVSGYFYWSLLDNFEWADGFGPKFGLYKVDRKTFERIARPSAKVYAGICKNNIIKISNSQFT
ncbi:MAG: glycoside hydrolase family 1 protein [Patescibacteria group bacterium]